MATDTANGFQIEEEECTPSQPPPDGEDILNGVDKQRVGAGVANTTDHLRRDAPRERAVTGDGSDDFVDAALDNGADGNISEEEEDEDEDGDDDEHDLEDIGSQLSLYEDILDASLDTPDETLSDTDLLNYCSIQESFDFRKQLRDVGEDAFIQETIENGTITAKRLCTAFGIRPLPFWLEGAPDQAYYPLLNACISRELSKRVKLPKYNSIDDAVDLLKKSKNIVVLTGAGISTSLGIPDFRSKDTGLYAQLEHLGLSDPQEVFEISLFREDPSIFYSVAKDILPSTNRFSPTHAFIRLLQDQDRLLTNFTQNIDNLEQHAGIQEDKLIQCHGSFATASCIECGHRVDGKLIHDNIKAARVAQCEKCVAGLRPLGLSSDNKSNGNGTKRKRSSDSGKMTKPRKKSRNEWEDDSSSDEDDEIPVAGTMKPDITFFGEDLPATFHDRLVKHDRDIVDLVIIIGTSLKVAPVSEVVGIIPSHVPQIYISREPCSHVEFDIDLLGDCDTIVTELARRVGWSLKHEMIPDPVPEARVEGVEGWESRWKVERVRQP